MTLSREGYKKINELNDKYNISAYEIQSIPEVEEFYNNLQIVHGHSCIVSEDDINLMIKILEKLQQ